MTDQDDVARDLVQRAHAEEVTPDFDVEAGLSDVLARAGAGDDAVAIRTALGAQPSALTPDDSARLHLVEGLSAADRGDLSHRKGNRSFHADLPGPVRRAGLLDEASRFDPATGSGQIKQASIDLKGQVIDSVQRTFSATADGHAVIDTMATGRRVVPFGGLTVCRAETVTRQIQVDVAAGWGQELGELMAREDVKTVIQWRRGPLDRARRALESIQNRLVSRPASGLPLVGDGVLYGYQDVSGRILYKIGGPDAPWLSITNELTPPDEGMAFFLDAPQPQTGEAEPPQWIGALLRDYPRVDEAMRSAAQANDGLLRGVRLGEDGVALVSDDRVILAAADHPWANRAQRAIGPDPSQAPLIRIEGDRALHVDRSELTIAPGSAKRTSLAEVWNTPSGDIYLHEKFRSMLGLETGASVSDTTKVIVQEAAVGDRLSVEGTASEPDVRSHGGAEWWRIRDIGISVGTGSTASPGSGVVPAVGGLITLVRPDANEPNIRAG